MVREAEGGMRRRERKRQRFCEKKRRLGKEEAGRREGEEKRLSVWGICWNSVSLFSSRGFLCAARATNRM